MAQNRVKSKPSLVRVIREEGTQRQAVGEYGKKVAGEKIDRT